MEKVHLLCDSHHGIYLPAIWVNNTENIWNIKQEDWEYISNIDNIEDSEYWDVWSDILSDASYTDSNGIVWTLHQDGDLFAVAHEEMTEDERIQFYGD